MRPSASVPVPALAVAAALLLAGCLSASAPVAPAAVPALDLAALPHPLVLEHDHAAPGLHGGLSSPNVQRLAQLDWDAALLGAYPAEWFGEMDVQGDLGFVAALMAGFAIVDLADPANPKTLSYTAVPPAYVADIKATKDGNTVLLGTQRSVGRLTGALGLPSVPVGVPNYTPVGAIGLQAWDATDKAAPVLAGYVYVDGGCHMVSVLAIGGDDYVYCAPNDNTVRVFRMLRAGPAVVFEPVSIWSPGDLTSLAVYKVSPTQAQFTHDMTVQTDPLTGDPVMFVSFWDLGVHVVDVKDPASPKLLGTWAGDEALLWDGKIHTTMATLIDGKRVVVTIPEYASIPAVFVLDATDYGAMRLLAEWQPRPDGDYGESPALFSTHNFQLVGSKLYLAMYHGGVWVLDLADPAKPTPVAWFLPDAEPDGMVAADAVPETWDVVVANGHVFVSDIPTGLYAVHIEGDPLDAAYDSFA